MMDKSAELKMQNGKLMDISARLEKSIG